MFCCAVVWRALAPTPNREKWIQEQLARRRGQSAGAGAGAGAAPSPTAPRAGDSGKSKEDSLADWKATEDDLYKAPEILKASQMFKRDANEMEESGERWLTGIAEVALPIRYL